MDIDLVMLRTSIILYLYHLMSLYFPWTGDS